MRGIVYDGANAFVSDALALRAPEAGEVIVRIRAAGLCHSDLSVLDGTIEWPVPVVLGHEGAGVVEEVGAGVRGLAPGDPVVLHTLAACGRCRHCAAGRPTWCRSTFGNRATPFTLAGRPCHDFAATSVFVERTVVGAGQAVKIPHDVPFASAALVGCGVITGVGAVLNRARVRAGETAAVFGVGGVGLNAIQGLRIAGASRIVAVDAQPGKEAAARAFGATDFVLARDGEDVAAAVRARLAAPAGAVVPTAGGVDPTSGGDWAFECVGAPRVVRAALESLAWGGNVVVVGVPPVGATVDVPVTHLTHVDRGILGCRYGSAQPHRDVAEIVDHYRAGRLLLDELVSQTYPLDDFERAVEDLHAGRLARGVLTLD
ncbi:MAG: alcohol dehydrogenase catalytic domain-containing protein [Myxococcales bacterium]|nr:alcohol dehydrogenase catalytic domain-containing protein [Myxococcales bacterium]